MEHAHVVPMVVPDELMNPRVNELINEPTPGGDHVDEQPARLDRTDPNRR